MLQSTRVVWSAKGIKTRAYKKKPGLNCECRTTLLQESDFFSMQAPRGQACFKRAAVFELGDHPGRRRTQASPMQAAI